MIGNKKIVIIGVCMLVILSTISVAHNSKLEQTTVTLIYDFHDNSNSISFEKTLNLSQDELNGVLEQIDKLWRKFEDSDSSTEKMNIFKEILRVEIENGLLPSSFTMENINETAIMLSKLFKEYKQNNKFTSLDGANKNTNDINSVGIDGVKPIINWDEPFIGFGSAACVVAPYSQVFAYPIQQLFIDLSSWSFPLFPESGSDTTLDFVLTIFAATMQIQICHAAAALGWAISFIPPQTRIWIGPYYAMWGLVGGISLTVYMKADPLAICLLDLCMWGGAANVILPFQIST